MRLRMKFSEDLTALATTAEARGQFVVKVGGVTKTVSSAALKSGAASIVQLTMAEKRLRVELMWKLLTPNTAQQVIML